MLYTKLKEFAAHDHLSFAASNALPQMLVSPSGKNTAIYASSRVVNIPEIFHSASGHASSGLVPSDQEFPDFQTSTYIQSH